MKVRASINTIESKTKPNFLKDKQGRGANFTILEENGCKNSYNCNGSCVIFCFF